MTYAALAVGVVGALGSTGASIYGASQAGKGGGGGPVYPVNRNPAHYDLANLFGSQKAANKLRKRAAAGNPSIFGDQFKQSVMDYMNPSTFGPGGPQILSSLIGDPQQYLNNFQNSLGFLDQSVNTAAEANRTGLLTNGTAYFDEALRRYMNEALPAAAETAGLGVTSSGFQATGQRAANDLFGQAALANIDLAESAANRRMQAAPLLQALTASRQALPLNLASQLTGLYNFEARKPLDTFAMLSNLGSQGPYAAPSYSPNDNSAATTAAILGGLGQFSNTLSNWNLGGGSNFGGSGTGTDWTALTNR